MYSKLAHFNTPLHKAKTTQLNMLFCWAVIEAVFISLRILKIDCLVGNIEMTAD